jgi:hypothetical protein
MENKKPKITDPEEYALIKSIYFAKDLPKEEQIDQIERWERIQSKIKNTNNNSR